MRALRDSPTLVTVALILAVFICQQVAAFVGLRGLFALSNPLLARPWTLVTNVYAHDGVTHLIGNALALALGGLLVEQVTTSARFHAFFVGVGALAGVTEVGISGSGVLGASGAILGLYGYLLGGNRITEWVVGGVALSPRVQLALGAVLAALITLLTASPRAALIAHFTGFLVGFLAGRDHLLAPAEDSRERSPVVE